MAVLLSRRSFLRGRVRERCYTMHPPWAAEAPRFSENCTRCDACIRACPERILTRGSGGYPEVDFKRGECTFCAACVQACEPGALSSQYTAAPWSSSLQVDPGCLAKRHVECRVCGDQCEHGAIRFALSPGLPPIPSIQAKSCTGCGACIAPCPVAALAFASHSEHEAIDP